MIKRRQTESKKKLLDFIKKNKSAVSFDNIEINMKDEMDRVTIYRILKSFESDGIIHKIVNDNKKVYYAMCHNCSGNHVHNHIHFQCKICDKMECISEEIKVEIPHNYSIEKVQFTVTGTCSTCNK